MSSIAKVQHYVPQFLLRNFGVGKKHKLFVYDKRTDRRFSTSCRNVAAESRFYDFEFQGLAHTLEEGLSKLEGETKPLLQGMLDRDSAVIADEAQRSRLCAFFAVQLLRTRAQRELMRAMHLDMGERLMAMARSPEERESIARYVAMPDENAVKLDAAAMLAKAPEQLGPYFAEKTWHLLSATRARPFYISDNPLAMHNDTDMKPRGNLGLGVRGIQIYFPLSPTRALAFWCPTLTAEILDAGEKLDFVKRFAPHRLGELAHAESLESLARSLESGTPLAYSADNVTHFNSLQVSNAERYVFSALDDFALVAEMVGSHPHVRQGRRMELV